MVRAEDIIRKKRDGLVLDGAELAAFVEGVSGGEISDAQIAAFTMATWCNGMTPLETARLTLAMRDSGKVLDWPDIEGPVLDKHSTGGVGDLVSLVLGPVVAACGGYVPMISGRGLGHTGGTLDKLESIPGFHTAPGIGRFKELVATTGIAIIGQSDELAPADRRIYAVRDVTATVSSPPLMISSILSKKLAEGLDGLVLDIKHGSGAFTPGTAEAVDLAERMSSVAANAGIACTALVTDMNFPLARSAGNALEISEAVSFLRGEETHPRLRAVTLGLAAELLCLGGLADSLADAGSLAEDRLASGAAAEVFSAMVVGQGGPADFLDRPSDYLAAARVERPVVSDRGGYVSAVDTKKVGDIVVALGGGRRLAEDAIDHSVGLSALKTAGERVESGGSLAVVHAANESDWSTAARELAACYRLAKTPPFQDPVIHGRIQGEADNENR